MAMEYVKCPHCGHMNGPFAINENIRQMSLKHATCRKCRKQYTWTAKYGRVETGK